MRERRDAKDANVCLMGAPILVIKGARWVASGNGMRKGRCRRASPTTTAPVRLTRNESHSRPVFRGEGSEVCRCVSCIARHPPAGDG